MSTISPAALIALGIVAILFGWGCLVSACVDCKHKRHTRLDGKAVEQPNVASIRRQENDPRPLPTQSSFPRTPKEIRR